MKNAYCLPPAVENAQGEVRKVGIELEFAGLRIERISSILQEIVGGQIRLISPYEHKLVDTPYGDFNVELDYNFLLALGRKEKQLQFPDTLSDLKDFSEDIVSAVAKLFVPFEIVSPPLPITELSWLDELCSGLRGAGALGTRTSMLYGFGLHLNPELPALDAETVLRYFQAFLVSYAWLKGEDETDLTRQITPHIQPFGKEYVRRVLQPGYQPDLATLINDYLQSNPTRNRAMDMLPLFAFLDEERVRGKVHDELVKARPTFHYRLPNCEIDAAHWTIAEPWNDWIQVERLACDAARLAEISEAYLAYLKNPVAGLFGPWAERSEHWLEGRSSA